MQLRTSLKLATAGFVVLSLVAIGMLFWLVRSSTAYQVATRQQAEFRQLGIDLANASDYLTDQARRYVQFGEKIYYENYWREINEGRMRQRVVSRLQELGAPQNELDLLEQAKRNSDVLLGIEETAMRSTISHDMDEGRRLLFDIKYDVAKKAIVDALQEFQTTMNKRAETTTRQALWAQNAALMATGSVLVLLIVVVLVMVWLLMRKLTHLPEVTGLVKRVAAGDLRDTGRRLNNSDEIGQLSVAVFEMVSGLREVVQGVDQATGTLFQSSESLLAGSAMAVDGARSAAAAVGEMAQGAATQSTHAEETLRTMEELQHTIQQIATGASQSAVEVQQSSQQINVIAQAINDMSTTATRMAERTQVMTAAAQSGAAMVKTTNQGMDRIRAVVGESTTTIQALNSYSAAIGEITQVIQGIAEQTNLLALNAAIEAARAGEHGRGFAVVADEVRRLAERSRASTGQIAGLIGNIQSRTAQAVQAMNVVSQEVQEGSKHVDSGGAALTQIMQLAKLTADAVDEINQAIQTVRGQTATVVRTFESVAVLTEENTAATEEMAASASLIVDSSENVAAVSRQTSRLSNGVTETVSQLNQMAEEVSNSAQRLSNVARDLRAKVEHFTL